MATINFVLVGKGVTEKIPSLVTHCPIMIREVLHGHRYPEELCRCDVVDAKKASGVIRCKSVGTCPGRPHLTAKGEHIDAIYTKLL